MSKPLGRLARKIKRVIDAHERSERGTYTQKLVADLEAILREDSFESAQILFDEWQEQHSYAFQMMYEAIRVSLDQKLEHDTRQRLQRALDHSTIRHPVLYPGCRVRYQNKKGTVIALCPNPHIAHVYFDSDSPAKSVTKPRPATVTAAPDGQGFHIVFQPETAQPKTGSAQDIPVKQLVVLRQRRPWDIDRAIAHLEPAIMQGTSIKRVFIECKTDREIERARNFFRLKLTKAQLAKGIARVWCLVIGYHNAPKAEIYGQSIRQCYTRAVRLAYENKLDSRTPWGKQDFKPHS